MSPQRSRYKEKTQWLFPHNFLIHSFVNQTSFCSKFSSASPSKVISLQWQRLRSNWVFSVWLLTAITSSASPRTLWSLPVPCAGFGAHLTQEKSPQPAKFEENYCSKRREGVWVLFFPFYLTGGLVRWICSLRGQTTGKPRERQGWASWDGEERLFLWLTANS